MNFPELASLVKHLHDTHYKLNPTLPFGGPLQIISANSNIPTYHDYVQTSARSRGIQQVNLYLLEYSHRYIFGRMQRYPSNADIFVSSKLSTCWKRYVAAKELSHLILDTKPTSMTLDTDRTVEWMTRKGMPLGVNDALDSEHTAAHFAAELLLPYELSQPLLRDKNLSPMHIATQFRVPLRIVQSMIREDGYLDSRDRAYLD